MRKHINGWDFNFESMVATRQKWGQFRQNMLKFVNGEVMCASPDEHNNLGVWRPFFDDPEKHYNEDIARAYADYLFELQVLSGTKEQAD